MNYDLWDVELGHYFGQYASEGEAPYDVLVLLARYGDAYADSLELGIAAHLPSDRPNLTGPALRTRARQVAVPAGN